ncbi:type IV pilus modification protein PilV [Luteimonas sp. MC1825]|nr:type IV pilus modification protein PilV [Luteimonas sp. MC1825]QOC88850.1 type IV pilus modification protein PilV [Luteimonas sp. MC1825]
MIEVLIALVVLAIGLLGLALLQTMNLRYTKSANQRTQAVNLAGELLDMMRSNRSELAAYAFTDTDLSGVTVPVGGCETKPALGAASNVERWKCEVREALGADARVSVVSDAAGNATVNVQWAESNMPALQGQGKVTLETKL